MNGRLRKVYPYLRFRSDPVISVGVRSGGLSLQHECLCVVPPNPWILHKKNGNTGT